MWKILKCFSTCCIQANPELTAIWAVGQRIWQRDFPGIYTAIAAYQWTENILPVMEALRGNNRNHVWFVGGGCNTAHRTVNKLWHHMLTYFQRDVNLNFQILLVWLQSHILSPPLKNHLEKEQCLVLSLSYSQILGHLHIVMIFLCKSARIASSSYWCNWLLICCGYWNTVMPEDTWQLH